MSFATMIFLAQRGDPMPWWFPFFVVGIWLCGGYLYARHGWRAFAERYGGRTSRPKGPAFKSPHTRFNDSWHAAYYGVVHVIPCPEGLWFYALISVRAYHPPFFVPWSLVTHVEFLSRWYQKGYRIHIQSEVGTIAVRLRTKFGEALLQFRPDLLEASDTPPIGPLH